MPDACSRYGFYPIYSFEDYNQFQSLRARARGKFDKFPQYVLDFRAGPWRLWRFLSGLAQPARRLLPCRVLVCPRRRRIGRRVKPWRVKRRAVADLQLRLRLVGFRSGFRRSFSADFGFLGFGQGQGSYKAAVPVRKTTERECLFLMSKCCV
jgi:hypothetical protein